MRVLYGNLWSEINVSNLILVTTNSSIAGDPPHLVMGRGAAKEAAERFPGLPIWGAKAIQAHHKMTRLPHYGVLISPFSEKGTEIGIFQVKHAWNEEADFRLINSSIEYLMLISDQFKRIAINFPGTGYGRQPEERILPYVKRLPDNVFVYKYKHEQKTI